MTIKNVLIAIGLALVSICGLVGGLVSWSAMHPPLGKMTIQELHRVVREETPLGSTATQVLSVLRSRKVTIIVGDQSNGKPTEIYAQVIVCQSSLLGFWQNWESRLHFQFDRKDKLRYAHIDENPISF